MKRDKVKEKRKGKKRKRKGKIKGKRKGNENKRKTKTVTGRGTKMNEMETNTGKCENKIIPERAEKQLGKGMVVLLISILGSETFAKRSLGKVISVRKIQINHLALCWVE